jgi:hypothetical protein
MLYEFNCKCGNTYEEFFHVDDCPESILCECGQEAKKIISLSGIQADNKVKWLASAVKVLQPDYERPVTTRSEYKKYLKEKKIVCVG